MSLNEFVRSQKKTLKSFCEKHDFSYGYLRIISCGRARPSVELALLIERATKGKVNRLDLLYPKKEQATMAGCHGIGKGF